jgi:hypothetical protein
MPGSRNLVAYIVLLLLDVSLAFLSPSIAVAQESFTKETIVKVWQARQDRLKSAHFKWKEKTTQTKGCISETWKLLQRDGPVTDVVPPQDTTFTSTCSVSFDGNKLRYACDHFIWSKKTKAYEPQSYLAVFNGETCKVLRSYGPNHESTWPQGTIRAEKKHVDANVHLLQPVIMTCRGMTSGMRGCDLNEFALTGRKVIINSHLCWELQYRLPSAHLEVQLYVDPERDFVILRYLTLVKGIVKRKIDVRFETTPQKEWLPKEWTIISNVPNGTLEESFQSSVTYYEVNPVVSPNEFELEFPPGTLVHDSKNKQDWIVKSDGAGRRLIPRDEMGIPYQQLLATEPGNARRGQPVLGPFYWPAVVGIVLAGGCLLVFVYRRFKQWRKT